MSPTRIESPNNEWKSKENEGTKEERKEERKKESEEGRVLLWGQGYQNVLTLKLKYIK